MLVLLEEQQRHSAAAHQQRRATADAEAEARHSMAAEEGGNGEADGEDEDKERQKELARREEELLSREHLLQLAGTTPEDISDMYVSQRERGAKGARGQASGGGEIRMESGLPGQQTQEQQERLARLRKKAEKEMRKVYKDDFAEWSANPQAGAPKPPQKEDLKEFHRRRLHKMHELGDTAQQAHRDRVAQGLHSDMELELLAMKEQVHLSSQAAATAAAKLEVQRNMSRALHGMRSALNVTKEHTEAFWRGESERFVRKARLAYVRQWEEQLEHARMIARAFKVKNAINMKVLRRMAGRSTTNEEQAEASFRMAEQRIVGDNWEQPAAPPGQDRFIPDPIFADAAATIPRPGKLGKGQPASASTSAGAQTGTASAAQGRNGAKAEARRDGTQPEHPETPNAPADGAKEEKGTKGGQGEHRAANAGTEDSSGGGWKLPKHWARHQDDWVSECAVACCAVRCGAVWRGPRAPRPAHAHRAAP